MAIFANMSSDGLKLAVKQLKAKRDAAQSEVGKCQRDISAIRKELRRRKSAAE